MDEAKLRQWQTLAFHLEGLKFDQGQAVTVLELPHAELLTKLPELLQEYVGLLCASELALTLIGQLEGEYPEIVSMADVRSNLREAVKGIKPEQLPDLADRLRAIARDYMGKPPMELP